MEIFIEFNIRYELLFISAQASDDAINATENRISLPVFADL